MKLGLLMPSILMVQRFNDRIFAPKDLFLALADGLVSRGHEVYVYSSANTKTSAHLVSGDEAFEKEDIPSVKIRKSVSDLVLFRLNAIEYEADIASVANAHAREHGVQVMHLYMDSVAHYWAETSSVPTVMTIHDPLYPANMLEGWRYRRFRHQPHVAISRRQKELYGPDFNIVDVVYHGVDVNTFPFLNSDKGYLAFVGRLIAEKGVEDALEVSTQTKIPLHIATSGNYLDTDYYTNHLKPLISSASAVMTGFMQKKERDAWMKGARAILCPIHWEEPFGMVMVEAMACGTPVIAYNRGSVPEIVKDGVTGFIIDEKEGVEGLVKAVKRIGEIDRAACRKYVEENFTVEKMVEGYERVYEKILSEKPA